LSHEEASRQFPAAMQIVIDRVKPERDLNRRDTRRRNWWVFGENAPKLRRACQGLRRFIATSEVAKHRVFVFLPLPGTLADGSLAAIAHDDPFVLGVLSSRLHVVWALAAGGRMGVGDDPRYQNGPCFQPFPFPTCSSSIVHRIRETADAIDEHRRIQQAVHPDLTITGMYNVLEKLRSGEALSAKDRVIHEQGLVSVLKKLHDDLDAAVFDAYGWPHDLSDEQILERLVALNAERAAEEKRGLVRWLRPEFQNPTGAKAATQQKLAVTQDPDDVPEEAAAPLPAAAAAWPKKLPEQIAAIRDLVARTHEAWTIEKVCTAFKGAKKTDVEEVLESLEALGLLTGYTHKSTRLWKSS
jgi:hypothetical protein